VVAIPEGERALDRARTQRPDLVVAASALRDMSGFSLCNRLRRVPGMADLPIVLVSVEGDASAVETHRGSKTPATQYLPPQSLPADLVKCVEGLLGLEGRNSDVDEAEEPLELEALPEEAPEESERTVIQARPSIPPPLPIAAAGPPPLKVRAPRTDPFAELPADPRLPMGASPEEKVQYFRERLKAKDDLLAKVRDSYQVLRDDLESADRDLSAARKELEERTRALEHSEQSLAQLRTDQARISAELDAAQTELSRGVHETATLRQDAEERAQNLSQLLNEAMQEREEDNKQWSAKLADSERKLALLQEEVEHLASELEARGQELGGAKGRSDELQAQLKELRQRAQEESAALSERLERLEGEKEGLASELAAERAALEVKEADLAAEAARAEAASGAVAEAEAALQAAREEWEKERQELESKQEELHRESQSMQETLEQRAAEAEAKQAELRGELEALQEVQQQASGAEARLAELEAELSSKVDELNGLRDEIERSRQDHGQEAAEASSRIAELVASLAAKETELREAVEARAADESRLTEALQEAERTEARAHSAEVELQRAEARARSAEAEAAEAEGRARDAESRLAHAEASAQEAETRAEAAQAALAKAGPPHSSSGSSPPGSSDKALRVRVSDLTLELQALRAKLAQAQGGGLSAEVARLKDELEAQRAENDFLTAELDRVQSGTGASDEL